MQDFTVYKILHDMHDSSVAQIYLIMYLVLETINMNCKTTVFITTSENFLLLQEKLTCGTVYQIVWEMSILLNYLNQD